MLASYSSIRPLPHGLIHNLDLFIAVRYVTLALWYTDMMQVHSGFRKEADGFYKWSGGNARRLLSGMKKV